MTHQELARALGPLVGPARRPDLGRLARGETDEIAVRYDEIRDWAAMSQLLSQLDFLDGQEWITLLMN